MEPRRNPPEYFLEIFADSTAVKDVLKGMNPFPLPMYGFFFLFFSGRILTTM